MSNLSRYIRGSVEFAAYLTANDGAVRNAIQVGDLVYVIGGVAYNAAHLADAGNATQNRAAFAKAFVGVAVQKIGLQTSEKTFIITDDPGWILVARSGVFEFDTATGASWVPDDLVGVYSDGGDGTYGGCSNQTVARVTAYGEAIGKAIIPYKALGKTTITSIQVDIRPMGAHNQIIYGSGQ